MTSRQILVLLFGLTLASRVAPAGTPAEIRAAADAYRAAAAAEKKAAGQLDAARQAADPARANSDRALDANTRAYEEARADLKEVNARIAGTFQAVVDAEAVPAGLKDEYLEARRRYDAMRPVYETIGQTPQTATARTAASDWDACHEAKELRVSGQRRNLCDARRSSETHLRHAGEE